MTHCLKSNPSFNRNALKRAPYSTLNVRCCVEIGSNPGSAVAAVTAELWIVGRNCHSAFYTDKAETSLISAIHSPKHECCKLITDSEAGWTSGVC